ncbi:MAG: RagB/SusD family nutrient uptake outer membrane protein [Bacteroidales bacterium]
MKKYLNYYSKHFLFVAFALLFLLPSCNDDILEEVPLDFLAPENAYSTKAGIGQGIAGLHFTFRDHWYFGDQDQGSMWRGVGTDVAFHGEDPNSTRFLTNYVNYLVPTSNYVEQYWDRAYLLIQRANVLIEKVDESDISIWANEADRNAHKAEAMFFRAYAYRILVSYFGDVPLVTEAIKSPKVDFVRNPKSEIYKLMEDDLLFGVAHLPARGQESEPGRINNAAASHVLAETYLEQGKFQLAADAASAVINSSNFALMTSRFGSEPDVFGTGDVYYDLFRYGNQNTAENTETIWAIQFEPLITGGASFPGPRAFGPAYFRFGNAPDGKKAFRGQFVNGSYTGYDDTLSRPVAWIRPTDFMAYTVWEGNWDTDYRNAKHSIKRDFYYDNPESIYDKQKIDFSEFAPGTRDPIRDTCQYIFPYFMKWADPLNFFANPAQSGGGWIHKDIYAIRLAETILLRAEAYVGLNQPGLAADDINMIRTRSNATPITAAQATLDYILDERARELYGEEWRHIVLRRMGKLVERVKLYNNNPLNPGLNVQEHHILWPIPQRQIDLNLDAVITQNPGYN